jgi:hypothetical protein
MERIAIYFSRITFTAASFRDAQQVVAPERRNAGDRGMKELRARHHALDFLRDNQQICESGVMDGLGCN